MNSGLQAIIVVFGHQVEMFGAFVAKGRGDVAVGVMIGETAFFAYAARFGIAIVISAPYGVEMQFVETALQQSPYGFGYQSTAPIGLPDPIAYLGFAVFHIRAVKAVGKHYTAAAHRLAGLFEHYRIYFGCGKYGADYFQTVFYGGVRLPAGDGAYGGVTRIS